MTMIRTLLLATALCAAPALATDRPAADSRQETRPLYLQLIHQARADGKPRAAIAYLDDFDRQFPNDVDARVLRANSLLDLGQTDAADAVLSTLPKTATGANVLATRGHVLAARGQWNAAIPFYQAAVTANPTDALLRNALGYALLRGGHADRGVEQLRGAADLSPNDEVVRNNLILALTMNGQKGEADAMIGQMRDRKQQGELKRLILAEAGRIGAVGASTTGKKAN